MTIEIERLVTVFESDLRDLERGYKRADDLGKKYVQNFGRELTRGTQRASRDAANEIPHRFDIAL